MKAIRYGLCMTILASTLGCQSYVSDKLSEVSLGPEPVPHAELIDKSASSNDLANLPSPPAYGGLPNFRPKAKGVYVSGWAAGTSKLDNIIELIDRSELNALVIDVKNDSGQVTFDSQLPLVNELGADSKLMIPDIKKLVADLKKKNIYTIARVVVFKDPHAASIKTEWAIHTKDGAVWRNKRGESWVDPYNQQVWKYTLDVAKEAADCGFDEIQFDYVRFPDNSRALDREVEYQNPHNWSKTKAISQFLSQARKELNGKGVFVSADVFGMTPSVSDDMGIGQKWNELASEIDVISPMIYPSHYGSGVFGVEHPDLQPYRIVRQALSDSLEQNDQLLKEGKQPAAVRPWLQDFTAVWVKPHQPYGSEEVLAQIQAAQELGIDEYLLWNSSCTYTFR